MAADSQQQDGACIDPVDAVKLYRVGDHVAGCAGEPTQYLQFLEWFRDRGDQPTLNENFSVLTMGSDGVLWWDRNCVGVRVGKPAAIGTGQPFAMAAMLAGASPKRAVEIAMKLDESSGGTVRTMRLK